MANKNEAKIKFTAETGDFNKQISKSNDEMAKLRAELKLNDAQMKTTGSSVEGLEQKQKLLGNQLSVAQNKTEALSSKLAKAADIFGENSTEVTKLQRQLANAKAEEERLKQAINICNNELNEQKTAAKQAESATAKLTNEIESQQSELDGLKSDYVEAVLQYGKTSKEAKTLAKEIKTLSGDLKESKSSFSSATSAADKLDKSLDDTGDSAKDAGDGFTIAKGAIADLAADAIQAAIGKVSEFLSYLKELPEATRELRQDMATLETSYKSAGFTVDQAKETWQGLYRIFGEDDRAVEAANLIARMSNNQEDLNTWVKITQGVWGTYQDSLPVEGLAEASMETSKTGQVTGVLADALNWSSEAAKMFAGYMSEEVTTAEDAFNEALKKCTTEEERQALITETLTTLYGDAAAKYEEASGSQLAAKEATAENTLVQNDLANAIEPVTTAWQGMKTEMLQGILPAVEKVSNAMLGAMDWMKEHPVLMKVIAAVLGVLATAIGTLIIVVTAWTVAQWALNSAILASPITWIIVAIVAAIAAVVAIIVLVIEYWDQIVAAVKSCVDWICEAWNNFVTWLDTTVIQPVKQFFSDLWQGIKDTASSVWESVKTAWTSFTTWIDTNIIQPVLNFFKGLWDGIKAVWDGICNAVQVAIMFIGSILQAAFDIITLPFRFIWENCKEYIFAAWEWIKNAVSTAVNAVSNVITTVFNAVKSFFVSVWNGIKNVFTTVWNAIVSFLSPIVNKIKTVITTAFNAVKNTVTTIFDAIKNVCTTVWNAIKTAIQTVVNAVKTAVTTAFNAVKNTVTSIFNGIKNTATSIWNGIKNAISTVVNAVKNTVSSVFNSVKSTVSNVFNGIKNTATSVWNGIKSAITKPIEAAKDKVKSVIDAIKGFFSGLKLKLPDIKMPHFTISGKFSLDPPSVPKLKIEWYKKAMGTPMILNSPTIFGHSNGRFLGGGEAGSEMIGGTNTVMGMIQNAVDRSVRAFDVQSLVSAIEDLASRPNVFTINGREVALATASDYDSVNGLRNIFAERGLALE